PTALGVKAAMPDRPVVAVLGDGGFMFGATEIATAVRHKIGLVAVVFNDNAYGNVRRAQQISYKSRFIASDLANPDFVKFAESFGVRACRVERPGRLTAELRDAVRSGEPALIEVPVGQFPDPWKWFVRPKVRGV
ncbi:MAG: TPP-binding protein, partial [Proteobacteria bacterium]|nr:TPP-binding protein [Pseudomonadota bacterium]